MAKKNDTLHSAKTAKNDEFYTRVTDSELPPNLKVRGFLVNNF